MATKVKKKPTDVGKYCHTDTLPARPRESAEQRVAYAAKVLHAAGLITLVQLRAALSQMAAVAERGTRG